MQNSTKSAHSGNVLESNAECTPYALEMRLALNLTLLGKVWEGEANPWDFWPLFALCAKHTRTALRWNSVNASTFNLLGIFVTSSTCHPHLLHPTRCFVPFLIDSDHINSNCGAWMTFMCLFVTVQVFGVQTFQFFNQIMKSSYFTLTNCTPVVAYLSQMVCAGIVLRVFQFPLEPSPIHLHHHSMLWWKDCNHDIVRYHACESSGLLDRLPWRGQGIHVQQWSFKYEIINLNNTVFLSLWRMFDPSYKTKVF